MSAHPDALIQTPPRAPDAPAVRAEHFACPECRGVRLTSEPGALLCAACGKRYRVEDGIPVFSDADVVFPWGVPPERLEAMLDEARRHGWHDAMMRLCDTLPFRQAQRLWFRTLGMRRTALELLLPLSPEARVLDFGSGWGTIALHLAQSCAELVALDQASLHLRWLREMSAAHQVRNMTFVQGGATRHLPFPDAAFDAVVLNGAFEWVAAQSTDDPHVVQQRMLGEVARILKPSGVAYIGIENRLNYKYFYGVPEGHINMRFGALLPRRVTRWYLRHRSNRPYREYTYSLFGYRNMLRRAGLRRMRFFAPWPSYGEVAKMLPVPRYSASPAWRVRSRHPARWWPGSLFTRAYAMTAGRGETPALLERIVKDMAQRHEWPLPLRLNGQLYRVTSGGKALMHVVAPDRSEWQVQVGLTPYAGRSIEAQGRAGELLRRPSLPGAVQERIAPAPVIGRVDGFTYGMRPFIRGDSAAELVDRGSETARDALWAQARDFLAGWHQASGEMVRVDEAWFDRLVAAPLRGLRQWFTAEEWREHDAWWAQVRAWLREALLEVSLPIVPQHGDFSPENCITDARGRAITAIVDWEHFELQGLPSFDALNFLLRLHRPEAMHVLAAQGRDPAQMKFHGYPALFLSEGKARQQLVGYFEAARVPAELLEPLVFMWWVKKLELWAPLRLYDPAWRRLRVFPVMERWQSMLEGRA